MSKKILFHNMTEALQKKGISIDKLSDGEKKENVLCILLQTLFDEYVDYEETKLDLKVLYQEIYKTIFFQKIKIGTIKLCDYHASFLREQMGEELRAELEKINSKNSVDNLDHNYIQVLLEYQKDIDYVASILDAVKSDKLNGKNNRSEEYKDSRLCLHNMAIVASSLSLILYNCYMDDRETYNQVKEINEGNSPIEFDQNDFESQIQGRRIIHQKLNRI